MSVHIHEVNENRQEKFLSEGRKDPFTKDKLKAGDRIVFCAGCKSAFLHSSWEAMRGRHCNQTETLAEFPHTPRLGDITKLQQRIQVLTDESTNQQTVIKDLTDTSKNQQVKIIIFATICCLFTVGIAGLGYFAYAQYQRITNLKSRNLDGQAQISSLEGQRDLVKQKISVLNNTIASDNCPNNSSRPTLIEEQVTSFQKNLDCFVRESENFKNERDSYKNERDFYKNLLNGYPYSLAASSDINYRGYLTTSNNKSNPILYRLYVANGSNFDIELKDMEADGDFEIIDSQGNTVNNSTQTNTGSDKLNNFYFSSGYYDIKIWNHSTNSSTYFTLRIYRQSQTPSP